MNAVLMLVWGMGAGAGVWLTVRAARPAAEPLSAVLARLENAGRAPAGAETDGRTPLLIRAERRLAGMVARMHVLQSDVTELAVVGRAPEHQAFAKLLACFAGVLGFGLVGAAFGTVGVGLTPPVLVPLCLVAGAFGFVLPDLSLRDEVGRRRRAFRHALSAYLDLVNVLLAGGAGIETALYAAADAGDGWSFEELRTALDRARRTGRSPWDTLAELASKLGIDELAELAASVSLAGSHGARIRSSLAAKADALRGHQLADTEAAAEAASERMTIPLAVLLLGFLVLIGYPAIQQITTATTGG